MRAVLIAVLLGLLSGGPAGGAWPLADSPKPARRAKSQPSVIERVGSATTGFLRGVKDALRFKRQPAKKPLITSSPFRQEQTRTAAGSSWFAKSRSK